MTDLLQVEVDSSVKARAAWILVCSKGMHDFSHSQKLMKTLSQAQASEPSSANLLPWSE